MTPPEFLSLLRAIEAYEQGMVRTAAVGPATFEALEGDHAMLGGRDILIGCDTGVAPTAIQVEEFIRWQ